MSLVLSLTADQQSWLEAQLEMSNSSIAKAIHAKMTRPKKAKPILLDSVAPEVHAPTGGFEWDDSGDSTIK